MRISDWSSDVCSSDLSRLPIPGLPPITPAPSLAVFADRLAELPLVYEPGTRWSYSVGLDLMGRVIEVVAGPAFVAFLKARLCDPPGMSSTYFQVPASEAGWPSPHYVPTCAGLVPVDPGISSM